MYTHGCMISYLCVMSASKNSYKSRLTGRGIMGCLVPFIFLYFLGTSARMAGGTGGSPPLLELTPLLDINIV